MTLTSQSSQEAAAILESQSARSVDDAQVERLSQHNKRRIESRNAAYAKLVPQLLAVTQDQKSHWRYVLTASVCACNNLQAVLG